MKGTLNFGLLYSPLKEFKLVSYSNSDWAGDTDDRKSDSGFVFYMGDIARKRNIVFDRSLTKV